MNLSEWLEQNLHAGQYDTFSAFRMANGMVHIGFNNSRSYYAGAGHTTEEAFQQLVASLKRDEAIMKTGKKK